MTPSENHTFEDQLRQTLGQRHMPPAGFAERVLARAETETARPQMRLFVLHSPVLRAVAATLVLAVALGSYIDHRHQQQVAGERARQQVLLALHITANTLQNVQQQINNNSSAQE